MSNKSLFVQAAEKVADVGSKLASLAAKLSSLEDIYTRQPMVDPLDNRNLGPARSGASEERGRHLGQLVGGLGGLAAGGALGGMAGHALNSSDPTSAVSLGEDVGGAAAGGYVGHGLGKRLGGGLGAGLGRLAENFASPESRAAEKVKHMDPSTALAHIHMTEQLGHESPSVIQAMKDSYNARRTGLQAQLGAGVAIPPGEAPSQIAKTPKPTPF